MRVDHLAPVLDPFASEPMLLALLKYRGAAFADQFVVTTQQGQAAAELQATGCELFVETEQQRLTERLGAADLINAHCPDAEWARGLEGLLGLTGKPFLVTLYGPPRFPTELSAPCICASTAAYRAQGGSGACELVGSGVDLERFVPRARPERTDRVVLTRVGHPLGQAEYFWYAIAGVLGRHPEVVLRIVGSRGSAAALGGGRPRRVETLGARADLAHVLADTDLLVAAPRPAEGGSEYGVLAAMAMGVPAVLTDGEGVRAWGVPGETALVVPDGDTEALTAVVEMLLQDGELRGRLGAAARELAVRRCDVRDRVRRCEEIYLRVIAEHDPGAWQRGVARRFRMLARGWRHGW